ncbi:MAG: Asp-tRNA(Asn)/Glu-tRNA(Gln) amidotransferase subunit GatA [Candidatus Dojkabacteria bacterium]
MNNLSTLTISKVVGRIKSGNLSSVELVAYHIDLAKTRGKELNAFITVIDSALDRAKQIDSDIAAGKDTGKLAGIPFTVKDVIMTKGVQTTASSRMLEGFIAPYTATVIERLEAEGAINIGKTNSDPFAFGASGENSGFGPTKNPIDETRVPGGSSSGAAASLAAGIGLFAIGTDTGGSVRQPASFCGLVGFKPTYGRNSRYGLIAMASSFDTAGILTRNVRDTALVESVMAGKDSRDATSYDVPVPDYTAELDRRVDLEGVKIGVPNEYFGEGLSVEVREKVEEAIAKYSQAGAKILKIDLPILESVLPIYYVLVPSEISSNMARYDGVRYGRKLSDDYLENIFATRGKFMEDEVKRRVMIGTYTLSAGYAEEYYKTALKVRVKLTREIDKVFDSVDVIMGPTSPVTAFKLGEKNDDPLQMYLVDIYTVTANLVGVPAISINCGTDKDGLPVGLQLMTKRFNESQLFALAAAYEKL